MSRINCEQLCFDNMHIYVLICVQNVMIINIGVCGISAEKNVTLSRWRARRCMALRGVFCINSVQRFAYITAYVEIFYKMYQKSTRCSKLFQELYIDVERDAYRLYRVQVMA